MNPYKKLTIICLLIGLYEFSISQVITPATEIYFGNNIEFLTFSDPCVQASMLRLKDGERAYLLGIKSCQNNPNSLRGELFFHLLVNNNITYCQAKDGILSYPLESIISNFKDWNELQLTNFKNYNYEKGLNYYKQLQALLKQSYEDSIKQVALAVKAKLEVERYEKEASDRRKKIEEDSLKKIKEFTENNTRSNQALILSKATITKLYDLKYSFKQLDSLYRKAILDAQQNGGVLITGFEITENYSITGAKISIFNCTKKRIKYISFKLRAYNDVDDPIGETESVRGIGYIEAQDFGSWDFEDIWYVDYISYIKIVSLTIEFEDGSIKSTSNIDKIKFETDYNLISRSQAITQVQRSFKVIGTIGVAGIKIENEKIIMIFFYDYSNNTILATIQLDEDNISKFAEELSEVIACSKELMCTYKTPRFSVKDYSRNIYVQDPISSAITLIEMSEAENLLNEINLINQNQ